MPFEKERLINFERGAERYFLELAKIWAGILFQPSEFRSAFGIADLKADVNVYKIGILMPTMSPLIVGMPT